MAMMADFNVPGTRIDAPNRARARLRNLVAYKHEVFEELRRIGDRIRANLDRVAEIKVEIEHQQRDPHWADNQRSKKIVDDATDEIAGLNEEKQALEAKRVDLENIVIGFSPPADALLKHLNLHEARLGVA